MKNIEHHGPTGSDRHQPIFASGLNPFLFYLASAMAVSYAIRFYFYPALDALIGPPILSIIHLFID